MKKMKYVDIIVTAVFTVLVLILLFNQGCRRDIIVTLISAAVLIAGIAVSIAQYRKIAKANAEKATVKEAVDTLE